MASSLDIWYQRIQSREQWSRATLSSPPPTFSSRKFYCVCLSGILVRFCQCGGKAEAMLPAYTLRDIVPRCYFGLSPVLKVFLLLSRHAKFDSWVNALLSARNAVTLKSLMEGAWCQASLAHKTWPGEVTNWCDYLKECLCLCLSSPLRSWGCLP